MNAYNVIRPSVNEERYRCAVVTIIRDIQRANQKSLADIAEDIDVSLGTISNAVNEKTGLCATFLLRIGAVYGPAYLNPVLELMGAHATPIDPRQSKDILPLLTATVHQIALDRDPDGPGGIVEVPQEKKARLPKMKALHKELGCHIAATEAAFA